MLARTAHRWLPQGPTRCVPVVAGVALWDVFKEFLKLGAIIFGSGYVLVAFLQGDLVERLHWLTPQQLLDAVSVGQITPGRVFTTATFVGYLVAGFWGGVVATIGNSCRPSCSWPRSAGSFRCCDAPHWTAAAMDGINAAVIGLMVARHRGARYHRGGRPAHRDAGVGPFLVMTLRKPNFAWLILVGAVVGVAHTLA